MGTRGRLGTVAVAAVVVMVGLALVAVNSSLMRSGSTALFLLGTIVVALIVALSWAVYPAFPGPRPFRDSWGPMSIAGLVAVYALASCLVFAGFYRVLLERADYVVSGNNVVARWKKVCGSSAVGNHTVLQRSAWIDGKLVLDVEDVDACGGTVVSDPRYKLTGDTVQLKWSWKLGPEKEVTLCDCNHVVRFELANLPVGDYKIALARSNESY